MGIRGHGNMGVWQFWNMGNQELGNMGIRSMGIWEYWNAEHGNMGIWIFGNMGNMDFLKYRNYGDF